MFHDRDWFWCTQFLVLFWRRSDPRGLRSCAGTKIWYSNPEHSKLFFWVCFRDCGWLQGFPTFQIRIWCDFCPTLPLLLLIGIPAVFAARAERLIVVVVVVVVGAIEAVVLLLLLMVVVVATTMAALIIAADGHQRLWQRRLQILIIRLY